MSKQTMFKKECYLMRHDNTYAFLYAFYNLCRYDKYNTMDPPYITSPDGTVAKSSANELIGNGLASRYRLQSRAGP